MNREGQKGPDMFVGCFTFGCMDVGPPNALKLIKAQKHRCRYFHVHDNEDLDGPALLPQGGSLPIAS